MQINVWCSIIVLVFNSINNGNCSENKKKPNIIIIVADDMGFNDVSFHGSDEIPTPNIDALAYNGVILNSHYTQALCTPSRASLLTGKYPIHLGMQHLVILEPEPWGLPLNETILPQYLKRNGYTTRAIGKWHLGFFKKEYTPTFRGFDSHYGYWQGFHDYYDHTIHATYSSEYGYDMRNNMSINWDAKGKYSTTLFTEEATRLIHEHNTDNPLFMYFAHLAPHAANDWDPLQAPDEEISKFNHIEDPERRVYAAMVSMLDQSVGAVVSALREKRMLENSIIIFMSDNGAAPEGIHANHGSNYPFRGVKSSVWEGGLRNIAAIWSPLIQKSQRISNNLMHITDWLPTLYSAAGLNHSELPSNLDGIDQWSTISSNTEPQRKEILLNIDDQWAFGGVRQNEWKYVYGSGSKGRMDRWYGNNGKNPAVYHYDENSILKSPVGYSISGLMTFQQIKQKNTNSSNSVMTKLLNVKDIQRLRSEATVTCNVNQELNERHECHPMISPCLFNIDKDPCEMKNLATEKRHIFATLENLLVRYRKSAYTPINIARDPNADPAKHNGVWTNWQDVDVIFKKKISYNELSQLAISLISVASVLIILLVIILLILTFKKSYMKRTHSKRLYELADVRTAEVLPQDEAKTSSCFEEREKQLRTSLREEFRDV